MDRFINRMYCKYLGCRVKHQEITVQPKKNRIYIVCSKCDEVKLLQYNTPPVGNKYSDHNCVKAD